MDEQSDGMVQVRVSTAEQKLLKELVAKFDEPLQVRIRAASVQQGLQLTEDEAARFYGQLLAWAQSRATALDQRKVEKLLLQLDERVRQRGEAELDQVHEQAMEQLERQVLPQMLAQLPGLKLALRNEWDWRQPKVISISREVGKTLRELVGENHPLWPRMAEAAKRRTDVPLSQAEWEGLVALLVWQACQNLGGQMTKAQYDALSAICWPLQLEPYEVFGDVAKIMRRAFPGRPKQRKSATVAFQLKISLAQSNPLIWRRVVTPDCTLAQLHGVVQEAMGWEDAHLFEFEVDGIRFSQPMDDDWGVPVLDASKYFLKEVVDSGVESFRYVYDFGDSWEHAIKVEKQWQLDEPGGKAECLAGEQACPPEDCGGLWGYYAKLEEWDDYIQQNPALATIAEEVTADDEGSEEELEGFDEEIEWFRPWAEARTQPFDVAEANRRLARMRLK